MSTVTQLFLMYERPVHPGVYKLARIDGNSDIWAYWCGGKWGTPAPNPEYAAPYYIMRGPAWYAVNGLEYPPDRLIRTGAIIGWRGLAEPPTAE